MCFWCCSIHDLGYIAGTLRVPRIVLGPLHFLAFESKAGYLSGLPKAANMGNFSLKDPASTSLCTSRPGDAKEMWLSI